MSCEFPAELVARCESPAKAGRLKFLAKIPQALQLALIGIGRDRLQVREIDHNLTPQLHAAANFLFRARICDARRRPEARPENSYDDVRVVNYLAVDDALWPVAQVGVAVCGPMLIFDPKAAGLAVLGIPVGDNLLRNFDFFRDIARAAKGEFHQIDFRFHDFLPVETAVSSRRWSSDTSVSKSNASCSVMFQDIFGPCAVTLRNAPNIPTNKFIKPDCSLFSVSVLKELKARKGIPAWPIENAFVANSPASLVRPDFARIFSETLFVASNTA